MIRWDIVKSCWKDSEELIMCISTVSGVFLWGVGNIVFWTWLMPQYGFILFIPSILIPPLLVKFVCCYFSKLRKEYKYNGVHRL